MRFELQIGSQSIVSNLLARHNPRAPTKRKPRAVLRGALKTPRPMFARSEPHLGPSVTPSPPFSQLQIAGIMAGALLAILLSALDLTIVNPALTSISTDLHSLDHLAWIIVAYFITTTALTPVYGKLSDIYGRGRTMVVAIVIFVAASALCGGAQTLDQLVALPCSARAWGRRALRDRTGDDRRSRLAARTR